MLYLFNLAISMLLYIMHWVVVTLLITFSEIMFELSYNITNKPYLQWLPEWQSHLPPTQAPTKIPLEAQQTDIF